MGKYQVAVVTGGSNGLGREICLSLNRRGFRVYNLDIDANAADDQFIKTIKCDITKKAEVVRAANIIVENESQINVLVNNAGVNFNAMIEDTKEEDWDRVMNVNAKAILFTTQAFLDTLKETKGTICNVVSNAAYVPMTSSIVYNASKGAAFIMTRQMARELTKRFGITVFGICPNKLKGTKMSEYIDKRVCEVRGWTPEYAHEYQLKGLLTGKETDPAVIADMLGYLLSEKERHEHLSGCLLEMGC